MTSSQRAPVRAATDGSGHVLLCTDVFLDGHRERLTAAAPGLEPVGLGDVALSEEALERVTIAFMSRDAWPDGAGPFVAALRRTPVLQWFHVMSAGVDGPIFEELRERNVRVTRSAGASAGAMAETVFMFLHGLARDLRGAADRHHRREFAWHEWRELEGRSIAVLGYGPVGRRVVDLAAAYRMRPTIVRRRVRGNEPFPTRTLDHLPDISASHDVIVVALPHTPDTDRLISSSILDLMTAQTLFVNVARGALVDQDALTAALATGRLGGAGLDVFDVEPLPADHPLWDLPNVLITPHNSGSGRLGPRNVIELFFTNLERYLHGEELLHEV